MLENIILLITAILIVVFALIRSTMRDAYLDYENRPCKGESCRLYSKKAKFYRNLSKIILWIEQLLTIIAICAIILSVIEISLNHLARFAGQQ